MTKALQNVTFDELVVGQTATIERRVAAHDLHVFAHASGNTNPLHRPSYDPDHDGISDAVAPSLWVGSLISTVLGTLLPGAGTLYKSQSFSFLGRAQIGDKLTVTVTCKAKHEKPAAVFETTVTKGDGGVILKGEAIVDAPLETVLTNEYQLPTLVLDEHDHFAVLIERCKQLPALKTVVVCPDDKNSLNGAILSRDAGLIDPIFVGDKAAIEKTAVELGQNINGIEIIDIDIHSDAAAKAVAMVNAGQARALMKGNIHSDELLMQIVKKDGGLRGNRRISHVFVMDVPTQDSLLFISDAAINIAPDLTTKVDIVQNAIDVARACGIEVPKVGVLAAVETVNVNMPSTIDAACLSKMAERGQIKGGLVDGPLAMDNAMDLEAARTKGIKSQVAGQADVLIVPNLEAGNMLAKELTFVARAEAAGVVAGARAPVILTSRSDNDRARLASCAVALLYNHFLQTGKALTDEVNEPLLKAAE